MALSLDEIQPGYFYEIIPSKLTPKHPHQLKQIRILMVSDKTDSSIAVRYPSMFSLKTYFNGGVYTRKDTKRMPALDEKYVMDVKTAREVLVKRISGKELEEMKGVLSFWSCNGGGGSGGSSGGGVSKKGSCLSELKTSNMVHWGKRRRVRFLSRHEEISSYNNYTTNSNSPNNYGGNNYNLQLLSSSVRDEDEDEDGDQVDLKEEGGGGGSGGGDEESNERVLSSPKNQKRNRNDMKTLMNEKNTRARSDDRRTNPTINAVKRKIVKHSICRWSADRLT